MLTWCDGMLLMICVIWIGVWRENCITLILKMLLMMLDKCQASVPLICAMKSVCRLLTCEWVLMSSETHVIPDQITSHPMGLFLTICFFIFSLCVEMLACCVLHVNNDLSLAAVMSFEGCDVWTSVWMLKRLNHHFGNYDHSEKVQCMQL